MMRLCDFLKHFKGNFFQVMMYDKKEKLFKQGGLDEILKESEKSFDALGGFDSELWEQEVNDWKVYDNNIICVKLSMEHNFDEELREAAGNIVSRIDAELEKLEEEMLQKRIENDPELKDKELSQELREQLLEEIREKCQNIEG